VLNLWACLRVGAVPVLANTWWSEAEFTEALDLLQPVLVLADAHGLKKLAGNPRWPTAAWHVDESADNPTVSLPKLASGDENSPAVIIFTSGTQGRAKAVVLAHRSIIANQMMILHVTRKLPYRPDLISGDFGLHTGPLFHIGGIQALVRAVLIGNTLVFGRGRFDPAEALELIEKYRIVRWSAVPTMVTRILEHPDCVTRDTSSLTAMTIGGAPVHAELMTRVRAALPSVQARIATGYGLSENGGQATTASGTDTANRPGTTGRSMPLAEIQIVPVPGLPDGEIFIRSPTQMLGYYGLKDSPIARDGWLQTGDLGKIDADGYVWITGRTKDIIIRGGENIAPAAVEEALAGIPGVVETAVLGVPHAVLGEEVMAVVVVEDGLTATDMQAQLRSRLASFAIPTRWHLQSAPLPVNQTGKIDKVALRKSLLSTQSTHEAAEAQ
jgi:acyl-CoA synthetase (AMP-forming)/AMP-acid ligase II